jgi:hypothetical protein
MEGVIKTDQIRCFDADGGLVDCNGTGQDGELQFGIEWPIPRFEEREGVTIDRLSGLMWSRDAGLTKFPQTWSEALNFVKKMNRETACGYQDWHLPSRRELFSLVCHSTHPLKMSVPAIIGQRRLAAALRIRPGISIWGAGAFTGG